MADVRIVDGALVALIGAENPQTVYDAVTPAIHALLPDSCVLASARSMDGKSFGLTSAAGVDGIFGPARRLLGAEPFARVYDADHMRPSDLASYRSGTRPGGHLLLRPAHGAGGLAR